MATDLCHYLKQIRFPADSVIFDELGVRSF